MTPRTLLEKKVTRILAIISAKDEDMIAPEMRLDDLGIESLDVVEITVEMEAEFGVPISDADAAKMVTVRDVFNLIEKLEKQTACASS